MTFAPVRDAYRMWLQTAPQLTLDLDALTEREARGVAQVPGEAIEPQSAGIARRRVPPVSLNPPAGLGTAARVDASRSVSAPVRKFEEPVRFAEASPGHPATPTTGSSKHIGAVPETQSVPGKGLCPSEGRAAPTTNTNGPTRKPSWASASGADRR